MDTIEIEISQIGVPGVGMAPISDQRLMGNVSGGTATPSAIKSDRELAAYFQYLEKFLHDLWMRTGGGDDSTLGYLLNTNSIFSPVPTLQVYDPKSQSLKPDICGNWCLQQPSPSGALISSTGIGESCGGYTSCYEYLTNKYTTSEIPNLQNLLNGATGSYTHPFGNLIDYVYPGVQICAFTGACMTSANVTNYCPANLQANQNQTPAFTNTMASFVAALPCASYLQPNDETPPGDIPPKSFCGTSSSNSIPKPWDVVYQKTYSCQAPSQSTSDLVYNQFGQLVVPPPAGMGTQPSISAYEICGQSCSSFNYSNSSATALSDVWTGSCTPFTINNTDFNSNNVTVTADMQPTVASYFTNFPQNTGITGCAVTFSYIPKDATAGSTVYPVLCNNGNGNGNGNLGLDMQMPVNINTNNVFLSTGNNGKFYLFSTFDLNASNPTTMYVYDGTITNLPSCPSTIPIPSLTGGCDDLYESFDTWNYSQMFVDTTQTDTSFVNLPYTSNYYSSLSNYEAPCNQPPFPSLF
jgi:hypothetical protein